MSGRRLLDVAALFNASRGVAQKHIALRSRQLDVYSRTSSLAKAVKSQTDRVTETAKAASFLASRLNESPPAWTAGTDKPARGQPSPDNGAPIPSKKSTNDATSKEGIEQDHFYEKSGENSVSDAVPKDEFETQQEKADQYPLPDGTIPPKESNFNVPEIDRGAVSKTSPKSSRDGFKPALWGSSTIPIPDRRSNALGPNKARELQRKSEQQILSNSAKPAASQASDKLLEGHDQDVYYSPSGEAPPVLSSLPRVKIPKQTEDTQGGDGHVSDGQINSDSYYSSKGRQSTVQIPAVEAVPEQNTPGDVNMEIFYSPRVAKLLGGETHRGQREKSKDFELKAAARTPVEQSPLTAGKDQDTFNVRTSKPHPLDPNAGRKAATNGPTAESGHIVDAEVQKLADDISKATDSAQESAMDQIALNSTPAPYQMRESRIPSSRLGRLWNYSGLAAGMFSGAVSEGLRRVTGSGGEGSYMLSPGNMDRLVAKLSKMRGAALKLGQMMSFQDEKMFPAAIQQVLQRVQDSADYMPASQRNKVLAANLGAEWRELFSSFDEKPLAAASIGQVHSAVLASTGEKVAVKVQYPGVASSIDSDLNNLAVLLTASRLLPKGLYLDKTIANARVELGWECDYIREAEAAQRFQSLLADDLDTFVVPKVYPEASGAQVLTMEFMEGKGVTKVANFTQEQKDRIGTQILRLCLREITEFKFMQTDPNWTNFLYNARTNKLELLDFGASREYPAVFIDKYSRLLVAASRTDRRLVRDLSIDLRYLTGAESKAMLDAHIASVLTLAEPFLDSSPEVYDFKDQTITERVKVLIPVMIRERLAPPPEETYSLHRKLSGAFLLCARLGSRVRCRELFEESMGKAGLL